MTKLERCTGSILVLSFISLCSSGSPLGPLLQERSIPAHSLRSRTHNKNLIDKTGDLNERNFIIRLLYKLLLILKVHVVHYLCNYYHLL